MKILITGVAGFIGSHVAERLNALGHQIIGIDNFNSYYDTKIKRRTADELEAKNITVLDFDLRDIASFDTIETSFDYIFHFAAQPGISSICTFEDYLTNNLIATRNLLDFALLNDGLKLFINIGTSSIYGKEACFSEDTAPQPISNYGVTKLAAEQLVLFHSREEKLKACSLRLYSVYGPRERPDKLYPKLIESAFKGKPFTLFEGSAQHLRSFTFVGDIVDGIVNTLGKEEILNSQIINLGSEQEHTTQEGIDTVEKLTGKKIEITLIPKRAGDQFRTKAIIDKAYKILEYNPQTTLEQGVQRHIDWYLENNLNTDE